MKKTNENISFAIYSIAFAWNCVEDHFGASLHIEDKAPEWASIAGNTNQGPKRVNEEDVMRRLRLSGKRIRFASSFLNTINGMAFNYEQCHAAGYEVNDHIIIFYEPLIEMAENENELVRLAFEFVIHELRHIEQFVYLRSKGINPTDALIAEKKTQYGEGPLEKDAYAIQRGNKCSIEEAMACFF